ncbi:hypothetical protein HK097_004399 [Rhizophlyctis rosea]|uniref:Chitin deacetylase n=1 Tax=Rhizophlyctis rosea TaxID=64517 RepID=A0AAD5X2T1_9FUNG|nr:hypothetical protein HK097_004399 [Rhizophlyctis rosea]
MQTKLVLLSLVSSAFAAGQYGQCGGRGFTGDTSCPSGWSCRYSNDFYSQCLPGAASTTTTRPPVTTTTTTTTRPPVTTTTAGCAANTLTVTPAPVTVTAPGNVVTITVTAATTTTTRTTSTTSAPVPTGKATFYSKCKQPNTLAMTFDDGPAGYHRKILDTANAAGAKVTFFTNGKLYNCIYDSAATLYEAYTTGHQVASHTWSHPDLTGLSDAGKTEEIVKVENALKKIIGAKPTYLRPPYGSSNDAVLTVAGGLGYRAVVNWDLDSQDWNGLTPAASLAQTSFTNADNSGHIILSHENYQSTVDTLLPNVIAWAKQKGWKLVTVGECLGEDPSLWYKDVGTPSTRDSTWVC